MKLRPALLLVPIVAIGWLAWLLPTREVRDRSTARDGAQPVRISAGAVLDDAIGLAGELDTPPSSSAGAETMDADVEGDGREGVHEGPDSGTSRGRLVDAATGEGIPAALVVTGTKNDWTDGAGWFDTGAELDALADLMVVNVARTPSRYEVARERWQRKNGTWRVPLSIGPTYRLRFTGVESGSVGKWEGRLRQEGRDEDWRELRPGRLPFLRYGTPIDDRGGERWIEVQSADGCYEGRGVAPSVVGAHEVEIECRARAVLRGRVVDEQGQVWPGIAVDAVQVSANDVERLDATTGRDGAFSLSAAQPGRMQVVFTMPSGRGTRELALDVPGGVTIAPDVVVPRRDVVSLRGALQSRAGHVVLAGMARLRALDGSGYESERRVWSGDGLRDVRSRARGGADRDPAAPLAFDLPVPEGRYELSIVSQDGFRWSPATLEVVAPAAGLVFVREDEDGLQSYAFAAVDAETHAPVKELVVTLDTGAAWRLAADEPLELARGVRFGWTLRAPGYREVSGNERDFVTGDGVPTVRIELHRGFVARVRVCEWSRLARYGLADTRVRDGLGLAGAEILVDGVPVAVTGSDGTAELDLPEEPRRVEARLRGWRVVDVQRSTGGTIELGMVRE